LNEFVEKEYGRAERSITAARCLVEIDPDSAASRAYYAAFHAVTALFAAEQRNFTKHTAIRAAVHRDLVKAGRWSTQLGEHYDYFLDLRELGDYGGLQEVTAEAAQTAVDAAIAILENVKQELAC
jgi:uncharacterized protein (UPF0332 family)